MRHASCVLPLALVGLAEIESREWCLELGPTSARLDWLCLNFHLISTLIHDSDLDLHCYPLDTLLTSMTLLAPSTTATLLRTPSPRFTRSVLIRSHTRTLTSTAHRSLVKPRSHFETESEQLNEAQSYLASKAARKAERARNPTGASARHASLYSQLFPALLRILAYGSSAYFGLHLLWNVLDRHEQTQLMNAQTSSLQATAKSLADKVDTAVQQIDASGSSPAIPLPEKRSNKPWYWPF